MGYFDALTSSSFKTAEDGRKLFFPWGTVGRGYVIPSEDEFERLRGHVKAYLVISLPLIIVVATWNGLLGGVVVLPFLIVPYALWARAQCRRLTQTDEKLTLSESVASQPTAEPARAARESATHLELGPTAGLLVAFSCSARSSSGTRCTLSRSGCRF